MRTHVARAGESILTLAAQNGLRWETLWEANEKLRTQRRSPATLCPGDTVLIPDIPSAEHPIPTGQRSVFRFPNSLRLELHLVFGHEPVANTPCEFNIDGTLKPATSNADGIVSIEIPYSTRSAMLTIPSLGGQYALDVSYLQPIETERGIRSRLHHLGYREVILSDQDGAILKDVLARFQAEHGLAASGVLDDVTRERITEIYGC